MVEPDLDLAEADLDLGAEPDLVVEPDLDLAEADLDLGVDPDLVAGSDHVVSGGQ